MPVQTHERHQTSRGGLNGSDASGWALLAAREELGDLCAVLGEFGPCGWGLRHVEGHSDRESRRAARGAEAALVVGIVTGLAAMLTMVGSSMLVASCLPTASVLVDVARRGRRMHVPGRRRAQHRSGHRTPNREGECQQDEEPDAERLHNS